MCSSGGLSDRNVLENTEFKSLLEKIQISLDLGAAEQDIQHNVEDKKQDSIGDFIFYNSLTKQVPAELLELTVDEELEDDSDFPQVIFENMNALLNIYLVAADLTLKDTKVSNIAPDLRVGQQMNIPLAEKLPVEASLGKSDTAFSQSDLEIDEGSLIKPNLAQWGLFDQKKAVITDVVWDDRFDFSQLKPGESQETFPLSESLFKQAEFTYTHTSQPQPTKSEEFGSVWVNLPDKTQTLSILEAGQNQGLSMLKTAVQDGQTADSIIFDSIFIPQDIPINKDAEVVSFLLSHRNMGDLKPTDFEKTVDEDISRIIPDRVESFKKFTKVGYMENTEDQDLETINYQTQTDYDDDDSTIRPVRLQTKPGLAVNTSNITEESEEKLDFGSSPDELPDSFKDNNYNPTTFLEKVTHFQSVSTAQVNRSNLAETIVEQIVSQVTLKVSEEHQEISIQLKPDFLGKVNIRLEIDKGIVNAEFLADSQVVKETIAASLPQLRLNMQELGMTLGDVSVDLSNHHNPREYSHDQPKSFPKKITGRPHQANILTHDHPLDATWRINFRV